MVNKNTFFKPDSALYYEPEKDHKVALVTGGNQGIGFYTILHLYLHGYKVYLLVRSEEKCLRAIELIKQKATERTTQSSTVGLVHFVYCDLLKLKTVKAAAEAIQSKEDHVDILINNAGIMGTPYELTEDNIELMYQVSETAHLLLTLELLPLLMKASAARVVFLTSRLHTMVTEYSLPLKKIEGRPSFVYSNKRYGLAKLAQIHTVRELSRRYPSILFAAAHPGVIHTNLFNSFNDQMGIFGTLLTPIIKLISMKDTVTEEEGCLSSLRAALDPGLNAKKHNAKYYVTGGPEGTPSDLSFNEDYIKQTWKWNIEHLANRGYVFDHVTSDGLTA